MQNSRQDEDFSPWLSQRHPQATAVALSLNCHIDLQGWEDPPLCTYCTINLAGRSGRGAGLLVSKSAADCQLY